MWTFLSILFFLTTVVLGYFIYQLANKYYTYVNLSEEFRDNFLEVCDRYTQALNDITNREVMYGDPVVFNLIQQTRDFQNYLINLMNQMSTTFDLNEQQQEKPNE